MKNNRVVITGLGVISPNGIGKNEFEKSLIKGTSGASKVTIFDSTRNRSKIACVAEDFNPLDFVDVKTIKRTSRFIQLAIAASSLAIIDSNLIIPKNNNIGVFVGTGAGGYDSLDSIYSRFFQKGPAGTSPFDITNVIPNMAASNVSIKWRLHGPCVAPVAACASGLYAINDAYNAIRSGQINTALAGGTESTITSFVFSGYEALRVLSTNNDSPKSASRPFDATRDGFVLGEGAGILVLESYESASRRGAKIYAEITSTAISCDATHITSPDLSGEIISKTMKLALDRAKIKPTDISFVNAHGTSTKTNDIVEARSINRVFGTSTPVTSIKSMIGHTLGASGAIACISSVLALKSLFIPPTINHIKQEPEMEPIDIVSKTRIINDDKKYSLINAFGFGGHNACIIIKSVKHEI